MHHLDATQLAQRLKERGHDLRALERLCGLAEGAFEDPDMAPPTLALLAFLDEEPSAAWRLLVPPAPPQHTDTAMDLFMEVILPFAQRHQLQVALGGARAMALHGLPRHTTDVDVFAEERARAPLLAELKAAGCRVAHVSADHFLVRASASEWPDDRIDLVFPLVEPALSALARPDIIDGVPVLPAQALTMAKLMAPGAYENADAFLMLDAGLADPKALKASLQTLSKRRTTDRFRSRLEDASGGLFRLQTWLSLHPHKR
jgi:hypothetical protein